MEMQGRSAYESQNGRCQIFGPAGANPIYFVHGSTLTWRSWQPQIEDLQAGFRVMSCDLPGHGARSGERFSMEGALAQINSSIEQLTPGRVLLVGISLGGHLATLFASRHPERIAGLVISGASMNFTGLVGLWTRFAGTLMLRMNEARLKRKGEESIRRKWPPEVANIQIEAGLYPYGAAQAFLELPQYDFSRELARVESPVLILNGEFDRPNRKSEHHFAANMPNVRVEVIPGAGHACNLENPAAYTASLRRFAEAIGWREYDQLMDMTGLNSKI